MLLKVTMLISEKSKIIFSKNLQDSNTLSSSYFYGLVTLFR